MTIEKSILLINDVYQVQIGLPPVSAYPNPFTPQERNRLAQYGEPVIACGGTFVVPSPSETFVLPDNDLVFPSQFPLKQLFAIDDYGNALACATYFQTTIVTRITAAITDIVDNTPGVIGTTIQTIDTGGN